MKKTSSPILLAFFNPLNLAMLALAAAAGLCSAWWLFPLGLVVWGVMVVKVSRDPALQLNMVLESRSALAQRFQKPFDQIERSQVAIFNNLNSAKTSTRSTFQPLQDAVNKLTNQAYNLCQRMSALENLRLVTKANRDLEGELFVLKTKLDGTSDPIARRDYEESQKALQDRLNNYRSVSALLDRVEAQLTSIQNTLDNIYANMIRLQAVGENEIKNELPGLLTAIQTQNDQLAGFEKEAANAKI